MGLFFVRKKEYERLYAVCLKHADEKIEAKGRCRRLEAELRKMRQIINDAVPPEVTHKVD